MNVNDASTSFRRLGLNSPDLQYISRESSENTCAGLMYSEVLESGHAHYITDIYESQYLTIHKGIYESQSYTIIVGPVYPIVRVNYITI